MIIGGRRRRRRTPDERRQDDSSHSPVSLYVGVATFRMLCAFSSSRGRHFTSPVSSRSSPFRASMNCICRKRDGHVQRSSERREADEKLQHRRGRRSQTRPASFRSLNTSSSFLLLIHILIFVQAVRKPLLDSFQTSLIRL